jgi:hypothetical protein
MQPTVTMIQFTFGAKIRALVCLPDDRLLDLKECADKLRSEGYQQGPQRRWHLMQGRAAFGSRWCSENAAQRWLASFEVRTDEPAMINCRQISDIDETSTFLREQLRRALR